jgi:hypothetical protein
MVLFFSQYFILLYSTVSLRKFLLKLNTKCWNSSFNAQGSKVIVVVVWINNSENTCSRNGGAQEKGKDRPPFIPYPFYMQNKEILSKFNMKCWNSTLNAQGSRTMKIMCSNSGGV